jgi:uncharacterized membrane protein
MDQLFFHWVGVNTLLAVIPVLAAYALRAIARKRVEISSVTFWTAMVLLGAIWLAFLPNTCYLLSEWRHLPVALRFSYYLPIEKMDSKVAPNVMLVSLFFLCYSGLGAMTFALAIRPIAGMMRRAGVKLWLVGIPFFILMSVGVYLGLVLRFNSWNLLDRLGEIWGAVSSIFYRPMLGLFVLGFAGFLWLLFIVFDIWIDGFVYRFFGRKPECRPRNS